MVYTNAKPEENKQTWGKYLQSSIKQLILGNYTDDVNLFGTVLQVLAGLADVDLPLDIRDLFYDVTNFEMNKQHIVQTILDAVALFPVVGGIKYVDEVVTVLKPAAKHCDEVAEIIKNGEKTFEIVKKTKKMTSRCDEIDISTQQKILECGLFVELLSEKD